jgi:hypothetical protein
LPHPLSGVQARARLLGRRADERRRCEMRPSRSGCKRWVKVVGGAGFGTATTDHEFLILMCPPLYEVQGVLACRLLQCWEGAWVSESASLRSTRRCGRPWKYLTSHALPFSRSHSSISLRRRSCKCNCAFIQSASVLYSRAGPALHVPRLAIALNAQPQCPPQRPPKCRARLADRLRTISHNPLVLSNHSSRRN